MPAFGLTTRSSNLTFLKRVIWKKRWWPLQRLAMTDCKNRLRVFYALLSYKELCACQITEFLNVAGATASRHLSLMVTAGLLKNRKQGRWVYFRINTKDASLEPVILWLTQKLEGTTQTKKDLKALRRIIAIPCEELSQKQRSGGSCSKIKQENKNIG